MVWEGLNVVKTGRVMLGATNPADSAPGTIRGDLCIQVGRNIIHGSDSVESANKEIALWFKVCGLLKFVENIFLINIYPTGQRIGQLDARKRRLGVRINNNRKPTSSAIDIPTHNKRCKSI